MNVIQSMNDLHGLTRAPGAEMLEMYKEQIPSPTQWRTKSAVAKIEEIQKAVQRQKKAEIMSLGITPFKQAPQPQLALQWARQNLNDPVNGPQARAVLQQLGAQR